MITVASALNQQMLITCELDLKVSRSLFLQYPLPLSLCLARSPLSSPDIAFSWHVVDYADIYYNVSPFQPASLMTERPWVHTGADRR